MENNKLDPVKFRHYVKDALEVKCYLVTNNWLHKEKTKNKTDIYIYDIC